ncbi:hypothetical protein D3C84_693480 [compost metagenome]
MQRLQLSPALNQFLFVHKFNEPVHIIDHLIVRHVQIIQLGCVRLRQIGRQHALPCISHRSHQPKNRPCNHRGKQERKDNEQDQSDGTRHNNCPAQHGNAIGDIAHRI